MRCTGSISRTARHSGLFVLSCLFLFLAAARASTEFNVPPGAEAKPTAITTGPDGNLWVFESGRGSIARITPTGEATEFPVNATPDNIVGGPDGALWFTDSTNGQIGRMTVTGVLSLYPLTPRWSPVAITSSVDGNLWFTERDQNYMARLARITTTGTVTEIANLPAAGWITSDRDGNLWIAAGGLIKISPAGVTLGNFLSGFNSVGVTLGKDNHIWVAGVVAQPDPGNCCSYSLYTRVANLTTDGSIQFITSLVGGGSGKLVSAPDGNVYFLDGTSMGMATPNGTITSWAISSAGLDIAAGPSGAWVTNNTDQIVEFTGSAVPAATRQLSTGGYPLDIASGPDGALWIVNTAVKGSVVRMTTSGASTMFTPSPVDSYCPGAITSAPDGTLWFVDSHLERITTNGTITPDYRTGSTLGPWCASYGPAWSPSMTEGSDGNLWFVQGSNDRYITRVNPPYMGGPNSFGPIADSLFPVLSGPDGNLWTASNSTRSVYSVTTSGTVTQHPLGPNSTMTSMAFGADGNLWIPNMSGHPASIYRLTPAGNLTTYAGLAAGYVTAIAAGSDGALWFAFSNSNSNSEIGRMTTDGVVTEVRAHVTGYIARIITGPDGKLWFTEPPIYGTHNFSVGRISALGGTGMAINAVEGVPFSGTVARFVDGTPTAVATDLNAVIVWGDGTTSPGPVTGPKGGPFLVSGTHTYQEGGSYQITVVVRDNVDVASYFSSPSAVTVADAPLSPGTTVFPARSCMEGANCPFTLGSFTDADPKAAVGLYTATVDWGDSGTSPGTITACGKEFCVSAYHTYAHNGSYNTKILASDTGGATLNFAGIGINVTDAPLTAYSVTPASPHGVQFTGVIATFTDADPYGTVSDFTASIDWGDTTSSPGTLTADGRHFDVTGTHTYSDPGPHTATVTINDVGGSTATVASTVADDYPVIATGTKFHVRLGKPFTAIMATFTDTDPAYNAGDLSATIDWGDGTTGPGVLLSLGNGAFNVQGTHTYTKIFGKDVTVQINDAGGNARAIVTDAIRLWPRTAPY